MKWQKAQVGVPPAPQAKPQAPAVQVQPQADPWEAKPQSAFAQWAKAQPPLQGPLALRTLGRWAAGHGVRVEPGATIDDLLAAVEKAGQDEMLRMSIQLAMPAAQQAASLPALAKTASGWNTPLMPGRFFASPKGLLAEAKKKGKAKGNPWAICTDKVGRDDPEKYESCVLQVKEKLGKT